jgi:hypothetical protein
MQQDQMQERGRTEGRKTHPVMCRGTGSYGAKEGGVILDVQN